MIAEKSIIETIDIPVQEIDLAWDHLEGSFEDDNYVIDAHSFLIGCYLKVDALSGNDKGDYLTPPTYWIKSQEIDVSDPVLFDSGGEEIPLSIEEKMQLCKMIEKSIQL